MKPQKCRITVDLDEDGAHYSTSGNVDDRAAAAAQAHTALARLVTHPEKLAVIFGCGLPELLVELEKMLRPVIARVPIVPEAGGKH